MRENNQAHFTTATVYSNKLTVSTKHSWGKKTFARQKATLWIQLAVKIKFWYRWTLLPLTPGGQGEHLAHLSRLSQLLHKCLPCLLSRWVSLGVLYPIRLWWFCWRSGWPKVKNLWLYNLKLEQAMRNLACGDLNCSYWGGLKLRKLVINDWVHVFPRLVLGDGRRVEDRWHDMYLFGEFLLGDSNVENWVWGEGGRGWPPKEEFLYKFCGTLHVWRSDRNC